MSQLPRPLPQRPSPPTEERLALHELIRVGVGRQEDLRLLSNIAAQAGALPLPSCHQLLREAALREQWRCGREAQLLAKVRATGLVSLQGAEGQGLTDQLIALQQVQEQHRQMQHHARQQRQHNPQHRPPSSAPRAPGSPQRAPRDARSSIAAAASIYGPSASLRPRSQSQRPTTALGGPGQSQPQPLLRSPSHGQHGPRPSTSASAASGSPYARSSSSGAAASSGRQTLPTSAHISGKGQPQQQGHARPSSGASWCRPNSAPGEAVQGAMGWQGVAASAAEAAQHAAHALSPDPGPGPGSSAGMRGRGGGVGSASSSNRHASHHQQQHQQQQQQQPQAKPQKPQGRFQQLLSLQSTLVRGLEQHAACDGSEGAHSALTDATDDSQGYFRECWQEAAAITGAPSLDSFIGNDPRSSASSSSQSRPGTSAPGGVGSGYPTTPGSPSGGGSAARRRMWDRLLRLGQLGLTRADMARLDAIRQARAARIVQRAVRAWLVGRRRQRAIEAAQARAARAHARLRERAATLIQASWRGHVVRKVVAYLRRVRARHARTAALAQLRRALAARRIQRAWRAHRRRRRYAEALRRYEASAGGVTNGAANSAGSGLAAGLALGPAANGPTLQILSHQAGRKGGGRLSEAAVLKAVVTIQAWARGWRVRRDASLWWARTLGALRTRRAALRSYQRHQRFMRASYDLQAQLLAATLREADVTAAALRDQAREASEFEESFQAWLLAQQRVALSQPLPRGWVPFQDPASGRMGFLNTRTCELHAMHPAMAELAGHASKQRSEAEAALRERHAGVAQYLRQLHDATRRQQSIALGAVAILQAKALAR